LEYYNIYIYIYIYKYYFIQIDQTLKKKNTIVTGLTKGIEGLFAKNKIDYLKGLGRFNSANEIAIDLIDGTTKTITSKNIIIATGSEPTPFPGLDFDEKIIISSTGLIK
jgi:dihydrolipoamide dehydrogenase